MNRTRRKRTERRMAQRLRGALQRFYRRVAAEMNAAPPVKSWEDALRGLAEELRALLEPLLMAAAKDGVRESQRGLASSGVDWALVNDRAAAWARQYAGELAGNLSQTAHERIRQAVQRFIDTPGATLQDLIAETTGRQVSEYRASVIAITETTRAYAEGNMAAWREAGVTKQQWQTNHDELVCEICGPLNGTVMEIGAAFGSDRGRAFIAPPAHVNCRCWLSPVVE